MNSATHADMPSAVNAIHHIEISCKATFALKVPAPYFAKTEKMLPKKIEETGFIKPARIVPIPDAAMEIQFALVVNANKDLHVGRVSAVAALSMGCSS
jgi:hypothetical protein